MIAALTKGRIEASGDTDNVYSADADLILTKERASWDLVK
jgi:hypothetical protein